MFKSKAKENLKSKNISESFFSEEALLHVIPLILLQIQNNLSTIFTDSYILKLKETLVNQLNKGKFDWYIFSDSPKVRGDLKFIIQKDNRSFISYLFYKCKSKKTLEFWFTKGVKLEKDAVGLALAVNSKIPVFDYLHDKGLLHEKIDDEDKENVLQKAKSLDSNTFAHIAKILAVNVDKYISNL